MQEEFKTLKFPNNEKGQQLKVDALREASSKGWRLISETITNETIDVGDTSRNAACLCFLCGPFCTPFLMSPTTRAGSINLTFSRTAASREAATEQEELDRITRLEAESAYRSRLEEDKRLSNFDNLMKDYLLEHKPSYVSKNLVKALKKYLEEDRSPFGKIPCIEKSRRADGAILLISADDEVLAKYPLTVLAKISDN